MRPCLAALTLGSLMLSSHVSAMRTDAPVTVGHTKDGIVTLRAPGSSMVLIRGGRMTMGSTIPEVAVAQAFCRLEPRTTGCTLHVFTDELPPHDAEIDDFWIDRTEVTNRAYRRCVDAGACGPPRTVAGLRWRARDDRPVTLVTWNDAVTFCKWRHARLPTETEWERAARGWSGRIYPWGNVYNRKILNHGREALVRYDDSDGYLELAPVSAFPQGRTKEGIADMAGNVEEWVADWYGDYRDAKTVNPKGPPLGDKRVVRGGSYLSGRAFVRSARRDAAFPSIAQPWRGFRCAKESP